MKELNISRAVWTYKEEYDPKYDQPVCNISTKGIDNFITVWSGNDEMTEECKANAQLIAEAGTVANECGKTPRELLEERNELLEALEEVRSWRSRNLKIEFFPLKKVLDVIHKTK